MPEITSKLFIKLIISCIDLDNREYLHIIYYFSVKTYIVGTH